MADSSRTTAATNPNATAPGVAFRDVRAVLESMNEAELRACLASAYDTRAAADSSWRRPTDFVANTIDLRKAVRAAYEGLADKGLLAVPPPPSAPAASLAGVLTSDGVPLCSHCGADLREAGELNAKGETPSGAASGSSRSY